MNSFRIFPLLPILLIALSFNLGGCTRSHFDGKVSIQIAYETEMPVDGGSTVFTEKLGTVHLSPPLLWADSGFTEQIRFNEVSLPGSEDFFLQMSPQIFLKSEKNDIDSNGMSMREFLKSIRSEFLESGKTVFLVIESDETKTALPLKIKDQVDPAGVYLQYSTPSRLLPDFSSRPMIHKSSDASDENAQKVKSWKSGSDQVLYAGEILLEHKGLSSAGALHRLKIPTASETESNEDQRQFNFNKSDLSNCEYVLVVWKDSSGNRLAERAYLWRSVPGLLIDCEDPMLVDEIKKCLRLIGSYKYDFTWQRIDFSERGMKISGGSF